MKIEHRAIRVRKDIHHKFVVEAKKRNMSCTELITYYMTLENRIKRGEFDY